LLSVSWFIFFTNKYYSNLCFLTANFFGLSKDKARYESADKFINRIPDFYLLWFQQLLECGMEEVRDLALQTILLIFNNAFTFFRLIKQQLSRRYAGAIGN